MLTHITMVLRSVPCRRWRELVRASFAVNFTPQFVREQPERFEALLAPFEAAQRGAADGNNGSAGAGEDADMGVTSVGLQLQLSAVDDFYRDGMEPSLVGIRCPTLVLSGAQDAIVPAANSALLHERIGGSELHLLPNSGHMFFEMEAEATAEVVARFLAQEAEARGR